MVKNYPYDSGDLFRLMSADQQQQLAGNIAGGLSQAHNWIHASRHLWLAFFASMGSLTANKRSNKARALDD